LTCAIGAIDAVDDDADDDDGGGRLDSDDSEGGGAGFEGGGGGDWRVDRDADDTVMGATAAIAG
jgi:hypothetical protein